MSSHHRGHTRDSSFHENIVSEFKQDASKYYETIKLLGEGSIGTVSKVKPINVGGSAYEHRRTGPLGFLRFRKVKTGAPTDETLPQYYALKSIMIDRLSATYVEELENEVMILRSMDHPNIVKAYEVFKHRRKIYLVLELCDGGDLYTRSPYTERDAAKIMHSLLGAVRYLHDHNIVHRDLKFENIMFENDSKDAEVKIIDFGLSKKFVGPMGKMTDRVGTIYTMSPQVLQGVYTSQADMWALGVIAYMLLSSTKPFYDKRRRKMIDSIMRGHVEFDAPSWNNVSLAGVDFVSKLIVVNPRVRLDAAHALKHEWIVNRESLAEEGPSQEIIHTIDDSLMNYQGTAKLKKLALNVIAHNSNSAQINELRKAFYSFDTDNTGVISFEEFKMALSNMNYSDEILHNLFDSVDVNRNKGITYTEFIAATIERHGCIEEIRIAEVFDKIDKDDTGYITKSNLRDLLGSEYTKELAEELIRDADENNDGKITYKEFLHFFRKQTHHIAREAVDMVEPSLDDSSSLLGLDAEIPGGKFDLEEE